MGLELDTDRPDGVEGSLSCGHPLTSTAPLCYTTQDHLRLRLDWGVELGTDRSGGLESGLGCERGDGMG